MFQAVWFLMGLMLHKRTNTTVRVGQRRVPATQTAVIRAEFQRAGKRATPRRMSEAKRILRQGGVTSAQAVRRVQ